MPDDVVYNDHGPLALLLSKWKDVKTHENDVTERTRGEEQVDPGLDLGKLDVEPGRNDTGLVQAAVQLNDDLARTMVVDNLELADVSYKYGNQHPRITQHWDDWRKPRKVERCGLRSEPRSVNRMEMCYHG